MALDLIQAIIYFSIDNEICGQAMDGSWNGCNRFNDIGNDTFGLLYIVPGTASL